MQKINSLNKLLFFFLSISLLVGLFFGMDPSGSGGFISDFNKTWPIVVNPFDIFTAVTLDMKFLLHYYIMFAINSVTQDQYLSRIFFCLVSISIPLIFYFCLKLKFSNVNENNLFLFSLTIFLLPSFRSGAIWANTQITALIFFLLSLLFFIKWEKQKEITLSKNLILSLIFMSCAVYSRQLYALIFLYYVYFFLITVSKRQFIKICSIIFILALPGIFFVIDHPHLLTTSVNSKLYNSLLINTSILSFYLIPFYLALVICKKIKLEKINKQTYFFGISSFVITLILASLFDYNYKLGGGYFLKLSVITFGNFYFFYLTSLIGIFFLTILSIKNSKNFIMIILIILGFTSFQIFQKYFEPMFLIMLFLLFEIKIIKIFLDNKKAIICYQVYMLVYLVSAVINDVMQITKNLI
jgi:hypothetical protein|tara:strand:- start:1749 stop:2984 length:1236 start_codon:yes stop_codon:yes gene_type:complete